MNGVRTVRELTAASPSMVSHNILAASLQIACQWNNAGVTAVQRQLDAAIDGDDLPVENSIETARLQWAKQCFMNGLHELNPHLSLIPTAAEKGHNDLQETRISLLLKNVSFHSNSLTPNPVSRGEDGAETNTSSSPTTTGTHTPAPSTVDAHPEPNSPAFKSLDKASNYGEGLTIFSSFFTADTTDGLLRSVAVASFNLGLFLLQQHANDGDETAAMTYFKQALEAIRTKIAVVHSVNNIHGSSHKRRHEDVTLMAAILHNMAYIHVARGRFEPALNSYCEALLVGEQVHDIAAVTLNCIGVLRFHLGQFEDGACLQLFHDALRLLLRVAVPNNTQDMKRHHCIVATIMNNIGRVHYMNGDYSKALAAYGEAIDTRRKYLGPDHLDVAAVFYNMGQAHHQLGNHEPAMAHYKQFLCIARRRLPEYHCDIAAVVKNIAQVYYERSELDQAVSSYEEAVRLGRLALGEQHAEVATSLNKLGNVKYELGDMDGALETYEEGLRIEKLALDPDHPNIVVTHNNIARVHKTKGRYDVALSHYHTILGIQRRKKFNRDDDDDMACIATTLYNIGLTWYQMGEYEEAWESHQHALHLRRECFGDTHLDVASILNSIGLVLFKQGLTECALETFKESLRIRRKLLGNKHRDVAVVLYNIATLMLDSGDEDEAIKFLHETLLVETSVLGRDHPDVLQTTQNLGHLYQIRGELGIAASYMEEALGMEERLYGPTSRKVADTLNVLGNLYLQLGQTNKVMSYFTQAERIHRQLRAEGGVVISGYEMYDLSKVHPECAAVA